VKLIKCQIRSTLSTSTESGRSVSTLGQAFSSTHFLLCIFKSLAVKLQCSAILRDRADDVLRSIGWHVSFNFKGDLHLCIEQPGKMLNHGSCYRIYVPRQSSRIQCR